MNKFKENIDILFDIFIIANSIKINDSIQSQLDNLIKDIDSLINKNELFYNLLKNEYKTQFIDYDLNELFKQ